MTGASRRRPELWAGAECTVARVGDAYVDQLELTGHAARPDDVDRLASLGVRALRFPILWERTERHGWSWTDERLARLRGLGIRPIAGLVHHGSGPPHTSLLDPAFPEQLAAYARSVAERYPWLEDWTPVNEPLTTARFSCLYGFWYPHRREALPFARALLNQVRAVVLAMRAVRDVVPGARLVQTDDLGKSHATPRLAYQAEHENERRWVTWDLLCGRRSGIEDWFRWLGIPEAELRWFEENPCPPAVVGLNHYLSSERFLDERLELHPPHMHGSNGQDAYVDELAVRILGPGPAGLRTLLGEAWERYGLPLAVTEAHNGCTREEQLRWLVDVWDAAEEAVADGADVRAVTVWSAFGAAGWDRLLGDGLRYESGLWDVRSEPPRETALAAAARALGRGERPQHAVLASPGWWRRPLRLWFEPWGGEPEEAPLAGPPLLVTGRTGTLGRAFARLCELRGLPAVVTSREELDAADEASVEAALARVRPWAVVNTAGYVRVDDAERESELCRRENALAPSVLARACARHAVPLVTFSSDLVFDGRKGAPYVESDPPRPLSAYGRAKAAGEELVLAAHAGALVIRTSAFFGPWDEHNFVTLALAGRVRAAADDVRVSPTYVPDLVHAALDLLIDGETGVWHLANDGDVSWAELAALAGAEVEPVPASSLGWTAPRPRSSVLGSERGRLLPPLEDALARYAAEVEPTSVRAAA